MKILPADFKKTVVGVMVDRGLSDPKDCLIVAQELYYELNESVDSLSELVNRAQAENTNLKTTIAGMNDFKLSLLMELEMLVPILKASPKEAVDVPGVERVIEILKK